MTQIEKDKFENKLNGYLFMFIGIMLLSGSMFADNKLGLALGHIVGIGITASGWWLIRTKKVYWSSTSGFIPKEDK